MDQIKIEITSINPLRGKEVGEVEEYIKLLLAQSFNGWTQGEEKGYITACGSILNKIKDNSREFEINPFVECWTSEGFGAYVYPNWKLGSIHSAEIISEGKVKIL